MRVVVKEAKSVRSCLIEEVFLHSLARSAKRCHSSARVSLVRRLTLDPEIVTKPRSIRAGPKVTGSLAPQATHASILAPRLCTTREWVSRDTEWVPALGAAQQLGQRTEVAEARVGEEKRVFGAHEPKTLADALLASE